MKILTFLPIAFVIDLLAELLEEERYKVHRVEKRAQEKAYQDRHFPEKWTDCKSISPESGLRCEFNSNHLVEGVMWHRGHAAKLVTSTWV